MSEMDPQAQTSFIPKKPLDTGMRRGGGGTYGLFFLIALLIFIASLIAAGGAFLYQQYLQQELASKMDSLKKTEDAYDPAVIQDLLRLDDRINNAEMLLNKHVAISSIFAFIGTQTLKNVYFTTFNYQLNPDGSANISLNGVADSFATVALQSDQMGSAKLLKNVVFSGIGGSQGGTIAFSLAATVDASVINYRNVLSGSVPAVASSTSQ